MGWRTNTLTYKHIDWFITSIIIDYTNFDILQKSEYSMRSIQLFYRKILTRCSHSSSLPFHYEIVNCTGLISCSQIIYKIVKEVEIHKNVGVEQTVFWYHLAEEIKWKEKLWNCKLAFFCFCLFDEECSLWESDYELQVFQHIFSHKWAQSSGNCYLQIDTISLVFTMIF